MTWRKIDERILSSSDLYSCSPTEKWLWLGMILAANQDGVISGKLKWLRRRIFGGSVVHLRHIQTALDRFEKQGMIRPFYVETRAEGERKAEGRLREGEGNMSGRWREHEGKVKGRLREGEGKAEGTCFVKLYKITNFHRYQSSLKKDRKIDRKKDNNMRGVGVRPDQKPPEPSSDDPDFPSEPKPNPKVFARLLEEFQLGHAKAWTYAARLTLEDLDAWATWGKDHNRRLMFHWMGKVQNPREIPDDGSKPKPLSKEFLEGLK